MSVLHRTGERVRAADLPCATGGKCRLEDSRHRKSLPCTPARSQYAGAGRRWGCEGRCVGIWISRRGDRYPIPWREVVGFGEGRCRSGHSRIQEEGSSVEGDRCDQVCSGMRFVEIVQFDSSIQRQKSSDTAYALILFCVYRFLKITVHRPGHQ